MEDGLEFDLALKNEMSGPANEAKSAILELTAALKANAEAVKAAEGGHKKHADGFKEVGKHAKESEGILKEFTSSLIPQIALGELAAEGLKKIGETIVESFKFAVEAGEFKENMTDVYSVVLDSADEGKAMFKEVDELAKNVHMPADKAHELASSLMLQGLESQEAVQSTIAAVSDLQRVGLAAGADKLQAIIGRSLAEGHFSVKAKQLKGTGVSIDDLYSELAHNLHTSVTNVKEEMKEGKIGVEEGTLALTNAIDKGKVGTIAAAKYTFGDVMTDAKNAIRGVFQETDTKPLIDAFKSMADNLKPGTEGAKELKETMDGLITVAGSLIDLAGTLGSALETAFLGIKHAAEGLRDAAQDAFDWITKTAGATLQSPKDKAWSDQAEKDVEARQNKEMRERSGTAWIDDAKKGGGLDIDKFIKEEEAKATAAGVDIGQGLADGLRQKADEIHKAGKELGIAAHEGAKEGADAHSPSRKMFGLGEDMGEGLMLGWESQLDDLHDSLSMTIMPPALDVAPSNPGGGRHIDASGMHVEINGVSGAEDILSLLPSAIVDALEQAANEMGG